jgi:hypothetical protein
VPTGLTYTQYVTQIATMAVVETNDPAFVTILPAMIDYAELRILRDLDMLSTITASASYSLTGGSRTISFPAADFVTLQQINVLAPPGSSDPATATRVSLLPVAKEFLDAAYPSSAGAGQPKYFAMLNATTAIVGPWPSSGYTVELVGTRRPPHLSPTTTTTVISTQLPDLLIMASMIYISGFQRNFGRQADEPQMAVSYESQYQALLKSAMVEEFRKKFQSGGWTSFSPSPIATPTRG